MQEMKTSFVVPVYNAENYIKQCIESIQSQSISNWELILVDDGSDDGSGDICKSYELIDNRIFYIKKENGGVSSARNLGLSKANGTYVSFIDSDDFIDSNYLELMLNKMEAGTCMVALGLKKYRSSEDTSDIISHRLKKGRYSVSDIKSFVIDDGTLSGFTFHSSCSVLLKKSIILDNQISFNETLKYNEDGLFVSEYLLNCKSGHVYVDYETAPYYYRINDVSATHSINMEIYHNNMKSIECELRNYIGVGNVGDQLLKRKATIASDTLLMLERPSVSDIKKMLDDEDIKTAFKRININSLKNTKKLFYIMIRWHLYWVLRLALLAK